MAGVCPVFGFPCPIARDSQWASDYRGREKGSHTGIAATGASNGSHRYPLPMPVSRVLLYSTRTLRCSPEALGGIPNEWITFPGKNRMPRSSRSAPSSAPFCPLSVAFCPLSAVFCPLSVAFCPLFAVVCPLSAVFCPLFTASCPLSARFFSLLIRSPSSSSPAPSVTSFVTCLERPCLRFAAGADPRAGRSKRRCRALR